MVHISTPVYTSVASQLFMNCHCMAVLQKRAIIYICISYVHSYHILPHIPSPSQWRTFAGPLQWLPSAGLCPFIQETQKTQIASKGAKVSAWLFFETFFLCFGFSLEWSLDWTWNKAAFLVASKHTICTESSTPPSLQTLSGLHVACPS